MAGLVDLSLFATSPTDDNRFTAYDIPPTEHTEFRGSYYDQQRGSHVPLAKACAIKPLPPLPASSIRHRTARREEVRSRCIFNRMKRSKSEDPSHARQASLQQRRRTKWSPQLTLTVPSPRMATRREAVRSDPSPATAMVWLEEGQEGRWRHLGRDGDPNQGNPWGAGTRDPSSQHTYPPVVRPHGRHSQEVSSNDQPAQTQPWRHPQPFPTVYSYYEPTLSAYTANNLTCSMCVPHLPLPQSSPYTRPNVPSFYGSIHHVTPDIETPPLTPPNHGRPNASATADANVNNDMQTPLSPIQTQFLTLMKSSRNSEDRTSPMFQEAVSGIFVLPTDDLAAMSPTSEFDAVERVWDQAAAASTSSAPASMRTTPSPPSSPSEGGIGHVQANDRCEDTTSPESSYYSGRRAVMQKVARGYHHHQYYPQSQHHSHDSSHPRHPHHPFHDDDFHSQQYNHHHQQHQHQHQHHQHRRGNSAISAITIAAEGLSPRRIE